jgi:hypothetical protein
MEVEIGLVAGGGGRDMAAPMLERVRAAWEEAGREASRGWGRWSTSLSATRPPVRARRT